MTNQEIFDKIISHMRTQKYSCSVNGNCRYYDSETQRKCAVGCLIPTELYTDDMDDDLYDTGIVVNSHVLKVLKKIGVDLDESLSLLQDMQSIHDGLNDTTEWGEYQEELCQKVARKYNLVYTTV